MIYRATHTTMYMYSEPVSICHTEVHLCPRENGAQTLMEHELNIIPAPDFMESRRDYFGNEVTYFSIHEPHETLTITATSVVEVEESEPPEATLSPAWESVREQITSEPFFDAMPFSLASPQAPIAPAYAEYARSCFPEGRAFLAGVSELSSKICKEFDYDPRATSVTTTVDEVLKERKGVCQDFAHLMIACLRSLGLPARYVSGYLRSGDKTVGAEASHAWVSVYCPVFGWQDFDPTNNVRPQGAHVTLAWGREYQDVTPVKGVALGGGEQIISVSVEVVPAPVKA
jgi:transglutaminase-like putative cysteine protease